jgi:hypothetical protein
MFTPLKLPAFFKDEKSTREGGGEKWAQFPIQLRF